MKKGVLEISQNSQEKTCTRVIFLNKVACLQACKFIKKETLAQVCNFIKKETLQKCFPVNFAKFLRTPFLQKTSGGLLL